MKLKGDERSEKPDIEKGYIRLKFGTALIISKPAELISSHATLSNPNGIKNLWLLIIIIIIITFKDPLS